MMPLFPLIAEAAYRYVPFLKPAPMWDWWYLLALPLCLIIAIIYKAVRCEDLNRVPREAAQLFVFIILVMVGAAAALGFLVRFLERLNS